MDGKVAKKIQHKLIRLALGVHCFTHVDDNHFQQLGWLPIDRKVAHLKKKKKGNYKGN